MEWYFVHRLRGEQARFQVQLLNEDGQAIASEIIEPDTETLNLQGKQVPEAVLQVAKRTTPGDGHYVDARGQLLDLWGNPLDEAA